MESASDNIGILWQQSLIVYCRMLISVLHMLLTARESRARRSLNIALDFISMGACSISSLRTFLYLPGSSVCDDPGKYKKSYYKLCCKQINVYFIFISIKQFHKTMASKISDDIVVCFSFLTNYRLKRSLYVKLKDGMSNSVDPDETAHMIRPIWIYAVCKSVLLSPVAVKVKESLLCRTHQY